MATQSWAKPKDAEETGGAYEPKEDPCYDVDCGIGHECEVDDDFKAVCICAQKCTAEVHERAKVCSTDNVTFDSECEFARQKCMCNKRGRKGCENRAYANMEMDYFGPCKELGNCEEWEKEEYPGRMREWLFLIMEELDSRNELNKKSSKMAKKALKMEKKWVIPVIWEFCMLDKTADEEVDVKELLPISAPLKPMERCTAKFLSDCDEDKSGMISKWEWGRCLGLETDDMDVLCEKFVDED